MKKYFGVLLSVLLTSWLAAQQPQTQTAPISALNAKYANGTAPGYWPQAGSGLTLNLSGGTAFCGGAVVQYAAGTLTMTASTTNYVYLNTSASCVPAVKTSTFVAADIPVATVTTSGSAITAITDVRTLFQQGGSGSGGSGTVNSGTTPRLAYYATSGTAISDTPGVTFSGTGSLALTGGLAIAATDNNASGGTRGSLTANINALNVQTEFRAQQGGLDAVYGLVGANAVANGSTVHQVNGVMGIVTAGAVTPVVETVGGYFQCATTGLGAHCYGSNSLVASASGTASSLLIGSEVDLNINNTGDCLSVCDGVRVAGGWGATPTGAAYGFHLTKPAGSSWTSGFVSDAGATAIAFLANPTAASGSSVASQSLIFKNFDSGGTLRTSTINANTSSNVVIAPFGGVTKLTGDLVVSNVSSSTSPICPNGTGGALTTSGCASAGISGTPPIVVTGSVISCPTCGTTTPAITQIGQVVVGSAVNNITFSSIPGTYTNLRLVVMGQSSSGSTDDVNVNFNSDTGANYDNAQIQGSAVNIVGQSAQNQSTLHLGAVPSSSVTSRPGTADVSIPSYAQTTFFKNVISNAIFWLASQSQMRNEIDDGEWKSTSAITSIKLVLSSGSNFVTGTTATLYGLQ
jgi:hypothetical protein